MKTYQEWTKPQNNWMGEVNWLWLWKWSQSMIKIDSKELLWKWSLKRSQGLESRFLVRKHEDVCTIFMSSLKVMCEKV